MLGCRRFEDEKGRGILMEFVGLLDGEIVQSVNECLVGLD